MPADLTPLWISLKTAFAATVLAFGLGIVAARWMMTYRGRGRGLIDGVFTLPLVLPPTVVGFLLLLLLGKNSPVGQLLHQFGLSIIFSWTAAVMAATVVAFPLMYKTVLGAFEQIDLTLVSSARTLGASEWRIFWQVLLPLAWPGVLAGTILAFARALGEFGATLMVGGSIPGVTQTIPIAIFFAAESGQMGVALAWVVLMVAISLLVIGGLNTSRSPKTATPTAAKVLLRWGFNWLYFGAGNSRQFATAPVLLTGPRRPVTDSPADLGAVSRSSDRGGEGPALTEIVPSGLPAGAPVGAPVGAKVEAQVEDPASRPSGSPMSPVSAAETLAQPTALPVVAKATQPAELVVAIEKQVSGFHLNVQFSTRHEPLGLLGASGSGKTMTLRCIAGLDTPSQGRIVLNGRVLFDAQKRINLPSRDRKVGLVFQNYALFPHMTVAQNIAFGLQAIPKRQRALQVMDYLAMMQLSGLGNRYPHELSGGQQQRVALARALAIQPDILLLDEPLSALDTYLRSHIEKLLIEVLSTYDGVTLFITHKLEEAYRVCRNLLVLANGQILADGTKEDIFERPPTFEVAQVTECKNFSRARQLNPQYLEALDWGCQLQVNEPLPPGMAYVGLRAHHVTFARKSNGLNTFPGWVAAISETQHRVSLYIKLHSPPQSAHDYHLQAEVYREKWERLRHTPYPWQVRLDPEHLMLMPY